jgi:hypothetical protein
MTDAKPAAMTAFAQAALAASDLVATKFASTKLGGTVPRQVKIEAPKMESTGGGKQARESIVLMPTSGDTAQALTAGFLDVGLRAAEVRSYGVLASAYQQRHKAALDLPQAEYDSFVQQLMQLLSAEGYVVKIVDEGAQAQKAQAGAVDKPAAGNNMGMMIAIGAVAALVVVAAAVFFIMK